MAACDQNNARLTRYRGDTRPFTITVRDRSGTPVDVSAAERITFGFFNVADKSPALILDLDAGLSVAASVITVTLPAEGAGELLGSYVIELEIVDGDGHVETVLRGEAVFLEDLITPEVYPE